MAWWTPARAAVCFTLLACVCSAESESARATWTLARAELAHFHRDAARELFAKAYQLDPRDPDIILSFAEFCKGTSRAALLRNVVAIARESNRPLAEMALARLAIVNRLGNAAEWQATDSDGVHEIPLTPFQPGGIARSGMLVPVSINGAKPLKLLLDSGADGIVIGSRRADGLKLEPVTQSRLGGFDRNGIDTQIALAATVRIGSLDLVNSLIEIAPRSLTEGADGVIGMNVFSTFRIELSAAAGLLRLSPLPAETETSNVRAVQLGHLIFIQATVNRDREGWFLLDTGAAFTTLARQMERQIPLQWEAVPVAGVAGTLMNAFRAPPVELHVGASRLIDYTPIALDLAPLSGRHGISIAGILGFSAMRQSTLSLNYRDGVVRFDAERISASASRRKTPARSDLRQPAP